MHKKALSFLFTISSLLTYGQNEKLSAPPPITVMHSFNPEQLNYGNLQYEINPKIKRSIAKKVKNQEQSTYQLMTLSDTKDSKNKKETGCSAFINYLSNDTVNIVIIPKQSASAGFRIIIIGDSCKIFHFYLGYDDDMPDGFLKLNKKDSTYKNELLVPPTFCKLILTKRPEFKIGEMIEGYIEFQSQQYYYKSEYPDNNAPDGEMQWYINGYFRTFDIQKNNSRLSTHIKK